MKQLSLLLCGLLAYSSTFGQSNFKIGIQTGIDLTNYFYMSTPEYHVGIHSDQYIVGYNLNITVYKELNRFIGIETDPGFLTNGSNNSNWITRKSYLNFPLYLKLFSSSRISPFIGPYASYLTSSKLSLNNDSYNFKAWTSSYDYGLHFGLSYKIGSKLLLNVKYLLGLHDNAIQPVNQSSPLTANPNAHISFGTTFTYPPHLIVPYIIALPRTFNRGFIVSLTYWLF